MANQKPEPTLNSGNPTILRPSQPGSYALGGDLNKFVKASDAPPTDIKTLLKVDSSNPNLRQLRLDQQLISESDLSVEVRRRTLLTDVHIQRPATEENK